MQHAYYMPNLGRAKIQHFGYKIKYFDNLFTRHKKNRQKNTCN